MFRHQDKNASVEKNDQTVPAVDNKSVVEKSAPVVGKTENDVIKDLLEKNLKWSQIIYEQNRKIHSKMMWTAVAGWIRVFLILVPLIWAIWYLPGIIQDFQNSYGGFFGGKSATSTTSSANSMEQLFKILPLDAAKQEQLKALLK